MKITEQNLNISELQLECGEKLINVNVRYHVLGEVAKHSDKVVWICHAFTANSNPADWWPEMVGIGKVFDPDKTPIVCVNILGSCYGTTGPMSINSQTGKPYLRNFPMVTFRDIARVNNEVKCHLGIGKIWMIIGGSIGGFQAMEWECMFPGTAKHLVLIATSAQSSPWVKAFSQSQRLSLLADESFVRQEVGGGQKGLMAARSIALLSYRGRSSYNLTQQDVSDNLLENYRACTYQTYQGEKLVKRFNAYSYYALLLTLDTHNMARNRSSLQNALSLINANTLVVGIDSDILFPVEEQKVLADNIPNAVYREIHSQFCHDGFLIEYKQLTDIIWDYLKIFSEEI
ncbi:MAG TPA: homoserine O-acetyltransferase [Tenuifilaceae bacterium]|nr:homoserine O-acetyltransferase [Tenuifilaceae bacterium]